jgi:HNH endonuclease
VTRAEKKRSQRIDEVTWQLFVRACGGRCCACGREKKLEQGHIQRHADGGRLVFENLIPLCKPCNGKHSRGFTRDSRPAGWRDAFWKLMLAENQVALGWQHPKPGANTLADAKSIENKGFLDMDSVEFVAKSNYSTPTADTPTTRPMCEREARSLMWNLFDRSNSCTFPPKRPLARRQDQMMSLAMRNGRQDFEMAGGAFLREEPWVVGDVNRGSGYAQADSWAHFCDSFDGYLKDGQARRLRDAARAELRKVEDAKRAAEDIVYLRQKRWNDYMLAARVQPWPDMTPEDRTFVAELVAEKAAGEVRDVSEERLEQSLLLHRRWKFYTLDEQRDARQKLYGELRGAKQKLYDKLAQCAVWAQQRVPAEQEEFAGQILSLREWIDGIKWKSVADLNDHGWVVDELHTSLDPSTPHIEFEDGELPF